MVPFDALGLLLASFLVGVMSSMIGVGGGSLIVPMLILVYGLPAQQAVGSSAAMTIFTALSSTLAYVRQRRVDYLLGILLVIGTIPGAWAGATATSLISSMGLSLLFGIFLILVAARMLWTSLRPSSVKSSGVRVGDWQRRLVDSEGVSFQYSVRMRLGAPLSVLGGFASGLFGVGGGAVMVPVMNLVMGVPMHVTVATSMFLMIFTTVTSALTHLVMGNVLPDFSFFLAVGVVAGAQIGARVARRTRASRLGLVFAVMLIVIGALLPVKSLLR